MEHPTPTERVRSMESSMPVAVAAVFTFTSKGMARYLLEILHKAKVLPAAGMEQFGARRQILQELRALAVEAVEVLLIQLCLQAD